MRGRNAWHASPRLPPGACHLAPARLAASARPRPRPRPDGGRGALASLPPPPAPISERARHLSPHGPRLRVSARPPHPAIKAPPDPTLDADADTAAAAAELPRMAGGISSKRRTSPASTSSSSGGDGLPMLVTRKRRSVRRRPRGAARRPSSAPRPVNELDLNAAALDPDHCATGLRVVLQKELRNSDVNQLGRIILPKKEAESYLPVLIAKDGISLCMHDLLNAQLWTFKYRYWPNNKSRMYVLENTGDYVKGHDLQQGDFIVIYKDDYNNRFVIGAKKAGDEHTATVPQVHEHMHLSATLPAPQVFHDYTAPVAAEADMLAIVPQADEIFDGILNSLPEIPVANVRYSDFFDPFGDSMDMTNPLGSSNHSVNLPATQFHDEKTGSSSFPYSKSLGL
ncbi:hypothetical protein U9M48_017931 [Paspalum notatum var. saurae]|uniref:TF-B3 domain-containing protein n=1 Tax=Paspalum notatum var. saurae TaxID=547442 RepID=A0AAQ3WPD1_PASNO